MVPADTQSKPATRSFGVQCEILKPFHNSSPCVSEIDSAELDDDRMDEDFDIDEEIHQEFTEEDIECTYDSEDENVFLFFFGYKDLKLNIQGNLNLYIFLWLVGLFLFHKLAGHFRLR